MARWLRQSTSTDVPIGPFVDETDGKTPETALTITQPDIRLKKNGGAWTQKNTAQTLTHEENGNYEVTLDTNDTNTLGLLRLHVNESGALPVWEDFLVVPANVYDSLFSTDLLQVGVEEWRGNVPNVLVSGRVDSSAGALANSVITSNSFASDAVHGGAVATSVAPQIRALVTGTSDAGGTTTTMIDAGRTETNVDHWKGCYLLFTTGSIANQCRLITGFDPTTDTFTFAPPTTAAVGIHAYEILPAARGDLQLWQGSAPSILSSGRVDVSVGEIATGAINAAAIAADAIGASELATDAVQEIADAILDRANGIETGVTLRQVLRGVAAALLGKASGLDTTTAVFRDINDTKDRITATVDADGNRSAVTTDLT